MALFDQTYINKALAQAPSAKPSSPWATPSPSTLTAALNGLSATTLEATSTAAGIANGSAATAAAAVSATLATKLGINSTDSRTAQLKAPVRDPIKAAFANRSPTAAKAFITDPTRGTLNDLDLGLVNDAADKLSRANTKELQTLATRLGDAMPINDQQMSELLGRAGQLVGSQSTDRVFGTSLLADVADRSQAAVSSAASAIDLAEAERYGRFAATQLGVTGSVGQAVTAELTRTFTAGLPALADVAGDAIANLPITVNPDHLNLIKTVGKQAFSLATDAYCNNAVPFGSMQNLFNGLLGLAARNGILCALANMLDDGRADHYSAYHTLRGTLQDAAGQGLAGVVEVIGDKISGGTVAARTDLSRQLIQKGHDDYDATTIGDVLDIFDLTGQDLVSEPSSDANYRYWQVDQIQAADRPTLDTLLSDATIARMADRSNPIAVTGWSPDALWV